MAIIDSDDYALVVLMTEEPCPDCTPEQACPLGNRPHGAMRVVLEGDDSKAPAPEAVIESLISLAQQVAEQVGGKIVRSMDELARHAALHHGQHVNPFGIPADPRAGGKRKS